MISFSGKIGSGKTSVSHALASELSWPRAAFSEVLKEELHRQGRLSSRHALQDLGQDWVERDVQGLCIRVLEAAHYRSGSNLILDGVRHVRTQETIAKLVAPSIARLIFIDASTPARKARTVLRGDVEQDFESVERHRVEAELDEILPQIADVVVDGDQAIAGVLSNCRAIVAQWRAETEGR